MKIKEAVTAEQDMEPPLKFTLAPEGGNFSMSDFKAFHQKGNPNTSISLVEVSPTTQVYSSPVAVELVKQGGMLAALAFICVFVYLLTKLIEASK
ncbi:hypothetical protein NIES2135_05110 [Leptolyngbya boryana NIES-2135]|jgi:hypothetical protein|uniref:Uncharacterized protein n=1 Tax=Leptolyngbya boryana NIES-2135 TaxID=1973484 RepID=A0A1Z4JAF1_LEPBY|nr:MULTISPECIES: hypothetical protein [Leptolyngbya]BAY53701.1 hypothetical protein NIES2135_05110 [Leptolyngbya boryana NIES-2135]MBD2367859.1 hypothetical protein [Leptolyngbya sp. FACHB-161]MBD2374293.1 hypothetical protein [Leptolyngbya sp. FACHB-238]MBD2398515.1 hypothetical protein [Leptolyngbya sp. FACHB-239]MBD2406217.1 hypothetical protein [Leptolyngbya sp. FACHB-402]